MHLTTTLAPIICIAIVTLLPLAAYSSPQFSPKPGPAPPPQTEELAAVTSSAEHNALSRVPAAALAELSAGNTDFAYDLYRAIRKKKWQSLLFAVQHLNCGGDDLRRCTRGDRAANRRCTALHPGPRSIASRPECPGARPRSAQPRRSGPVAGLCTEYCQFDLGTGRLSVPDGVSRPAWRYLRSEDGLAGFCRCAAKPTDDQQLGQRSHLGPY